MTTNENDVIHTRVTLLNRLKDWEDQASWQEFFNIYWKLIYNFARKAGLSESEAHDVVQEVLVSVAQKIPNFKYDPAIGTFKAWLLTLTRWRILDHHRKRNSASNRRALTANPEQTAIMERIIDENSPDIHALWEADWKTNIYEAALEKIKSRFDPQKYQIFDFYVKREWSPEKVAQAFNVKIDQVYLIKNRVTELLYEEVRRLENEVT